METFPGTSYGYQTVRRPRLNGCPGGRCQSPCVPTRSLGKRQEDAPLASQRGRCVGPGCRCTDLYAGVSQTKTRRSAWALLGVRCTEMRAWSSGRIERPLSIEAHPEGWPVHVSAGNVMIFGVDERLIPINGLIALLRGEGPSRSTSRETERAEPGLDLLPQPIEGEISAEQPVEYVGESAV